MLPGVFFYLRDLPALLRAMAIACFLGLPAFISVRMLDDTVFLDEPRLSGILLSLRELAPNLGQTLSASDLAVLVDVQSRILAKRSGLRLLVP